MMKFFRRVVLLFALIFGSHANLILAQDGVPMLLDRSVLSGVGLDKIDMKNEPDRDFFQKRLYRGKEISVYVVSSQSWVSTFDQFWFDEFIYILHGKAHVTAHGQEYNIHSRDFVFAPKGFPGAWEVQAGRNIHYELSVITNARSDSSTLSTKNHPVVLDSDILSGAGIEFDDQGKYMRILASGTELTFALHAEQPQSQQVHGQAMKEQLIHVLSGQLTFLNKSGFEQTFYTGDFFVLPRDFNGTMVSEGQSICKYLSVFKTPAQ